MFNSARNGKQKSAEDPLDPYIQHSLPNLLERETLRISLLTVGKTPCSYKILS